MASITNNHRMTLRLADGTVLKPNEATEVSGWDKQSKNKTVAGWVSAGLLSVDGKAKAEPTVQVGAEIEKEVSDRAAADAKLSIDTDENQNIAGAYESGTKDELKAKLDELGIEYDGRASVAKLRELLADHEG